MPHQIHNSNSVLTWREDDPLRTSALPKKIISSIQVLKTPALTIIKCSNAWFNPREKSEALEPKVGNCLQQSCPKGGGVGQINVLVINYFTSNMVLGHLERTVHFIGKISTIWSNMFNVYWTLYMYWKYTSQSTSKHHDFTENSVFAFCFYRPLT